ncbi:phage terminase large subunit-like protein [Lutibacter sp. Hel_I_33_5]|uniref:terminase large subunit n=1 Tax=Lutibacter sp. Hel_I_33_5 TaxID=1566289 RepID=UPI0011A8FA67|nr:terminase TerL endonuclease subunit [Lutibacter sp. Hel_I_33_5]TVZ55614.1 phage terminase large subunit-like protein [Lutibacter sp. Hel_I_33_5]
MQIPKDIQNSIPFQYAAGVKSGKIICGLRIKQAIDRFYKLIESADDKGYWLDHKKGFAVIKFIENFIFHTKGKSAGTPFLLSPYQQFRFYNTYAWQTTNESGISIRLIRNVYVKVAKKNGKTAEEAADDLFLMAFDQEYGAEIYVGATKEDQAKLCFNQASEFVNNSSTLKKLGFKVYQKEIKFIHTNSFMKPLGGDSKTQDGINAHKSTIDEYHAHKDDSVKENLESSSASRLQPLTVTITTAGTNVHGVCKNFEDACINILEGVAEDDTFLIMIHDLDKNDDWENEDNWIKANPNLGVTVSLDFLRKEYLKAKNQPSKIPNFKTKHLNMWVDGASEWIPSEYWNKCMVPIKEENFALLGNCGGLDLSTTTDITAFALMSEPDAEGIRDLKVWCFCPLDTIEKRSKEDRVPYKYWSNLKRENTVDDNDTYLIATPGNMVEYSEVEKVVINQYYKNKTKHIEYDRKFSGSLVQNLQKENIELSPFTQTLMNYASPTKEFMRLIMSGKLRVGNNPILKWMLSGCVSITDTNENIRLDKSRSTKRIDGIIASIMALAGTMGVEEVKESKYNDPDVPIVLG